MNESSCSEFMIARKGFKTKRVIDKIDYQRQGRWSSEENIKYLVFLSFNQSKFECKKKRMFRLYKPLSTFIKTRNSEQCRSHHRKLLQRFKTPKNIIFNLQQLFTKQQIQQLKDDAHEKLKQLHIPQKRIKNNEKLIFFRERKEQKNINQQQNCSKFDDKILQRQPQINSDKSPANQLTQYSSIINPIDEMLAINYQAFNWINQIYFSHFNYYGILEYNPTYPNHLSHYNWSLSFSETQGKH